MKRQLLLQGFAIAIVVFACSLAEAGPWGPRYYVGYAPYGYSTPTVYYNSPYTVSYGSPYSSMGVAYSYPYYGVQGYSFAYPYYAGYSTYPPRYNAYYSPWSGYYGSNSGIPVGYGNPYLFNSGRYGAGGYGYGSYGMTW